MEELKKQFKEIPLGTARDLSKKKFGKLQPLYRTEPPKGRGTYWVCKCDCGTIKPFDAASLTSNRSKSCGCSSQDKKKKYTEEKIGTILNGWKFISRDPKNPRNWIFECTCGSGIQKSMRRDTALISKGCDECSTATNKLIDLTNKKFGHWTVIQKSENKGCHTMWLCECDCEKHTRREIDGYALRIGTSTSCGCQHFSKGEQIISNILKENNIPFETQKMFKTCKTSKNNYAKFDFYINNQYIIEYDGEQHFKVVSIGWNDPINLARTKERDLIKNQWCKDNNIPLIRIPYTHLKDLCIEDLKLETSQFII